ncbi:MAG: SdrD B-like domain-containing protein, partial [Chloroflexota bacterium]|nr:SdrD B-like domain-containing protein [Chloroflexota bacterium]
MFDHKQFFHRSDRHKMKLWSLSLTCLVLLLPLLAPTPVSATSSGSQERPVLGNQIHPVAFRPFNPFPTYSQSDPSTPLQQGEPTTLTVSIISSPWAELDSNDFDGPQAFVVEAAITNTGTTTATGVIVSLDYNQDPGNNWVLLPGEDPDRTLPELASGDTYYAYWFASYPYTDGLTHQYTVTVEAANASPMATSHNYYNPPHGATVQTRAEGQEVGAADIAQVDIDIVVGVSFTITVGYGWNPGTSGAIGASPVGNVDFNAGAYRLLTSTVRLYTDDPASGGTRVGDVIHDHLYLPALDPSVQYAETTYKFIAVKPTVTWLCPYTMVAYSASLVKYHNTYCSDDDQTIIPFTSTLSISLTKHVSDFTIQQAQPLTYTMDVTSSPNVTDDLTSVWFWDNVPPAAGSIVTPSITPTSDPVETTASRVAWYSATISPGYTDTYTFMIRTDDNGQDLADGDKLINHAFFGINEGSLPQSPALTSTVTTTIQAPAISLSKTDGVTTTEPNQSLTYTLRITNSGSITATRVVITDVLPTNVNYASGAATPPETGRAGQTLIWDNLGPIPPGGGTVVVKIPVTVASVVPNGATLTNTMMAKYENMVGYIFSTKMATDTTTISYDPSFVDVYTFIDGDGDGVRDTGEGPLVGTVITMTRAAPSVTTTNGISQSYHFQVAEAGPISVTTSLPITYFRTTPGVVFLHSSFGNTQTVGFGFAPVTSTFGVVYGTVFEDANSNGVYDAGDLGLSSVTVTLDGSDITTTGVNGNYALSTTTATTHTVVETDPLGYFSTTPNEVDVNVSMGNGYQVDFGDATLDLTLEKTAEDLNGGPLYVGDRLRYVITVTNESGTTTMTGVV